MSSLLYRFATWLAWKLAVSVLIGVAALTAYGFWLYRQDKVDFRVLQSQRVLALEEERLAVQAERQEIDAQREALARGVVEEQERIEQADEVLAALQEADHWKARLFGDREQRRINAQRRERMETLKRESRVNIVEWEREQAQLEWKHEAVQAQQERIERRIQEVGREQSKFSHYLGLAWEETRWFILAAWAAFFLGPTLWAGALYWIWAPLVARGRPLRFAEDPPAEPEITEGQALLEATLWPGDALLVKPAWVRSQDEGLTQKKRWWLNAWVPLTCLACGLTRLSELRNGQAGSLYRVTLGPAEGRDGELALVSIPEGSSLMVRPRFLAGVIVRGEERVKLRRHWRLGQWSAWVARQIRFFEVSGPCRLVLAAEPGIRGESLPEREGVVRAVRRVPARDSIAFSPQLDYRPIRAASFRAYWRGTSPLFENLFAGPGLFLRRDAVRGAPSSGFWSSLWSEWLKFLGV